MMLNAAKNEYVEQAQEAERVTSGGLSHTRRTNQQIPVDSWQMTRNIQNLRTRSGR